MWRIVGTAKQIFEEELEEANFSFYDLGGCRTAHPPVKYSELKKIYKYLQVACKCNLGKWLPWLVYLKKFFIFIYFQN